MQNFCKVIYLIKTYRIPKIYRSLKSVYKERRWISFKIRVCMSAKLERMRITSNRTIGLLAINNIDGIILMYLWNRKCILFYA